MRALHELINAGDEGLIPSTQHESELDIYTMGQRVGGVTPLRASTPRLSALIRAITSRSSIVLTSRFSITILPSTITVSALSPEAE